LPYPPANTGSISISGDFQGLNQICYGHKKGHNPLAQLNLLLVFGERSGLQFYCRELSGDIPDVKTVIKLLDDLKS
jgi:transposase